MTCMSLPIEFSAQVEFGLSPTREIEIKQVYVLSDDGKERLDLRRWLTPAQDRELIARLTILFADEESDREEAARIVLRETLRNITDPARIALGGKR